jgi:uncharacterized phage protein gp47/JayE
VPISATITCTASLFTAVQSSVEGAIEDYLLAVGVNGTIRISELIETVMGVTGVIDISSVLINNAATNYTLGSSTTYEVASTSTSNFTLTYVTQ